MIFDSYFTRRCLLVTFSIALLSFAPVGYTNNQACSILEGSIVVANDGEYIGKITDSFKTESIFNEFGRYGNEFSSTSIWNKFGIYGSEFSPKSPWNEFSSQPPMIIKNNKIIGYLSVSKFKSGAIHPTILGLTCYDAKRR